MTLDQLQTGQTAEILRLPENDFNALRLAELGLLPQQKVTLLRTAPLGDPLEVRVMNYELCLRREQAKLIEVKTEIIIEKGVKTSAPRTKNKVRK